MTSERASDGCMQSAHLSGWNKVNVTPGLSSCDMSKSCFFPNQYIKSRAHVKFSRFFIAEAPVRETANCIVWASELRAGQAATKGEPDLRATVTAQLNGGV